MDTLAGYRLIVCWERHVSINAKDDLVGAMAVPIDGPDVMGNLKEDDVHSSTFLSDV